MTPQTQQENFFTDLQVAALLGRNPVTVRKWRVKNKEAGCIKFGPPYEYRGPNVVYPKDKFAAWCKQVRMVNGVPCMDMPVTSVIPLPPATVIPMGAGSNVE